MPHRPLSYLRELPRGSGGSHRRAAAERAFPVQELLRLSRKSFPSLSIFRPDALFRWLKSYSKKSFSKNVPFPHPTKDDVHEIPETTTIAIAGDWGTGTWEAAHIAELMKEDACEYTIHLGDVYYVGDDSSIKENCEGIDQHRYTPVTWTRGEKRTFAMNGNHEAYARDGAYFRWIRQAFGQSSSCFALYNAHWILLGLDTGYNSEGIPWLGWLAEHFGWPLLLPNCKLPEEAVEWLHNTVQPLLKDRGIVVLSHHQYFSSFDNEYPNAARQLAAIDDFKNRPVLWLWGHEHRFAAYDQFGTDGINAYGRCLGHGGMPVDRGNGPKRQRPLQFYDDRSYDPVQRKIVQSQTDFGVNGYALLNLAGANLRISYKDISGSEVVSEQWVAENGPVKPLSSAKFAPTAQVTPDYKIIVAGGDSGKARGVGL